ncbi:MAG: SDR family NAD(P)-dependent oxidoreductase [Clostridia bacterium]|nr:SDR family NAD(P)-dependent oxidoreductase [Clostridia bacterium]
MSKGFTVVTGACGGIGAAVVRRLLDEGYNVIGLDLRDNGFAAPGYTFLQTDITDPDSVRSSYAAVSGLTDSLAGIVNTAGIVFIGSLVEEDAELMQRILDVNVSGMARVNRVFFPLIEAGKGRFVNFSSEYGRFCSIPFHGYYTASKHAVERYTDSLRREMNYLGIRVVGIRPGAVNTSMTSGTVPAFERIMQTTTHFEKSYRTLSPLMVGATKHPTEPEVIADAVLRALTKKRPRRYYNIRQDVRVKLLSALPAGLTDFIFKHFI